MTHHATPSYSPLGIQPSSPGTYSATQGTIYVQSRDSPGQATQEACMEPIRTGPDTTVQCGGAVDNPVRGMCEYHYNQYYPSKYGEDWDKGPTPHTGWAQGLGNQQPVVELEHPQSSWTRSSFYTPPYEEQHQTQQQNVNSTELKVPDPQSSKLEAPSSKLTNEHHQKNAKRQADKLSKPRRVINPSSKPRRQPERTITEGHCPQRIKRTFSPSDPRSIDPPSMRLQCYRTIPLVDEYCGEDKHNDKNWNIPQEQTWINPPEPGLPRTIFLPGHPKLFPRDQN